MKKVVSGILLLLSISGILISIFGIQPSEAQAPETGWTLYTSGAEITALVDDGDFLWVGSYGGLAKLNKNTGDMTRYNTANSGLPDNMISSIAKDVNGDLWIGTDNGLARFNGVSWVVYNSGNSPLPRNDITCIAVDIEDSKWIGVFMSGLFRFDGSNWTVYNTTNSELPNDDFRTIEIDENGNKWLGTNGGGLAKFDGTNWLVYSMNNSGLPSDMVSDIVFDTKGVLWVTTDVYWKIEGSGGLAKFDGKNWTVYNTNNSPLPHNEVRCIAIDQNEVVMIGDYHGLVEFDGANWTIHNNGYGHEFNDIRSLIIDSSGNRWIGTFGGLLKFGGSKWTAYDVGNSQLPDNEVLSIAVDGAGNVWAGTFYYGLLKYDGFKWTSYLSGIPDRHVVDVAVDGKNNKWILTWDGLSKLYGGQYTNYGKPPRTQTLSPITIDSNNNPWILIGDYETDTEGVVSKLVNVSLAKFDGTDWSTYDIPNSLQLGLSSHLGIDSKGTVWIGANSYGTPQTASLAKFDGANWTTYNFSSSDSTSTWIYGLAVDESGIAYVSTYSYENESQLVGGDIRKFDGVSWTVYNSSNSPLPSGGFSHLRFADGNLYAVSQDQTNKVNVVEHDGETWTIFNVSTGFPNRRINSFTVDQSGGFWFATWGGLGVTRPAPQRSNVVLIVPEREAQPTTIVAAETLTLTTAVGVVAMGASVIASLLEVFGTSCISSLSDLPSSTLPKLISATSKTMISPKLIPGPLKSLTKSFLESIPDMLKRFLESFIKSFFKKYAEKTLEDRSKGRLAPPTKVRLITRRELAALGVSAFIMTMVFSYVEANGLPYYLNPQIFWAVTTSTVLSVIIVKTVAVFSEAFCAKSCQLRKRYGLWFTGFITLLISGFFLFPFSSPGITRYPNKDINARINALIALSKTLMLLTLTSIFGVFIMGGYALIGDVGLLATLATTGSSLIPIKPLPGKAIYDYKKILCLVPLISVGALWFAFFTYFLNPSTYLIIGIASALLAAETIRQLRKLAKQQVATSKLSHQREAAVNQQNVSNSKRRSKRRCEASPRHI